MEQSGKEIRYMKGGGRMKKFICGIAVLCLLLAPPAARAWWLPEDAVYGTREDLPAGVRALLPEELSLTYAYRIADALYAWTKDARGNGVVLVFAQGEHGYSLLAQSAPMGPWNGWEPFLGYSGSDFFSIDYSESYSFLFKPLRDGRWMLRTAFLYGPTDCFVSFYPHAAVEFLSTRDGRRIAYGTWTRSLYLDSLDVSVLPRSFGDALSMLDTRGWAMVKSRESGALTPLRTAPDEGGEILASYYAGAPAQILEETGAWFRVSIAGEEGWMAAEDLAFGEAMTEIAPEFPDLVLTSEAYARQSILHASLYSSAAPMHIASYDGTGKPGGVEGLFIIGVVGDLWYHVMNWEGETGYIERVWFFEGNG
jgi:hypothetical protein